MKIYISLCQSFKSKIASGCFKTSTFTVTNSSILKQSIEYFKYQPKMGLTLRAGPMTFIIVEH